MAAYFWVTGGTGDWNSASNWALTSGGVGGIAVPGSGDSATFDANSGSGTATLDISPTIQTLTCTGFTGTLAFGTNTITLNSTGTIFTGATTMAVTGTPQIICTATVTTNPRTITPTAVTEANSISFRFTNSTAGLTLTAGAYRDLDFTDGTNPTGYAGALGNSVITIYGNFKASTGMTRTAGTGTYTFAATSGTKTINTAGVTFDNPFTFNGVGGTWQLQAALTSGAARTVTLTNGTLDLASYTLTTGLFSSSNSNTRTLAFGTGKIVLTGTNVNIWSNATGTGFTYTGTSRIEAFGPSTTGTRQILPSTVATSTAATALSFYITGGSDTVSFTGTSRRVDNIDFTGFSGTFTNSQQTVHGSYTISTGMAVGAGTEVTTFASTSGTKTITINGKTLDFPITFDGVGGTWSFADALTQGAGKAFTITDGAVKLASGVTSTVGAFATSGTNQKFLQSSTPSSQATLSQATGTVDVSYLTIQDSAATGGATWIAYLANANIDSGNNTGWTFFNNVYANTAADSTTATDSIAAAATFNAAISETAALSDLVAALATFNSALSDTATVSDQAAVVATFNPVVSDAATLSDAAAAEATFNAAASDSATVSDSTSSAFLWNLIDDAQDPNWQNINTI